MATKTTAKAATTKTTAKATTAKKTTKVTTDIKEEVMVQFAGKEIVIAELTSKAKADFVAAGNKEADVKTVNVYVKPEESMAYYVVNDDFNGSINL